MENSVIRSKRKTLRLNTDKILALRCVKSILVILFGYITALPINPIGVSAFAVATVAVLPQNYVVLGYLGAFFSYLINSFYDSAAAVSALTAVMLFRILFKKDGRTASDIYIAPMSIIMSLCITGILCGDISSSNIPHTLYWLAVSAIASAAAIPFKSIIRSYGKPLWNQPPLKLTGFAAGIFLLLLPLGRVSILGINLLATVSTVASLYFAIRLNKAEAFGTALFFGAVWSLGVLSPFPIFILPVCIIISKIALPLGKLPFLACFISLKFATNLIFSPIVDLIPQMIETLLSSLLTVLIPTSFLQKAQLIKHKEKDDTYKHASDKIKETASLFRFLSNSISEVSEAISKELSITPEGCVSHIRDSLCRGCELSKFCCGIKNEEVSSAIHNVASDLIYDSEVKHSLPRCAHHSDMRAKIEEYVSKGSERSDDSKDIRALSTDSYKIVSDVLTEISNELTLENDESEEVYDIGERIEISALQLKNEREIHSGDSYEYFTKGKYLYLIISDGMGSGKLASIDSKMTCGLLKRFLSNGFSFTTSVKLANTALKLKGGEETFATADICRINTEDGSITLGKAGAAASYVVSENRVRKLNAMTFPIGILNEIRFQELSGRLKKNDYLIMLSDGALNNGDQWLEERNFYGLEPGRICEKIIKLAKESYGSFPGDDITAICVRLK